MGHHAGMVGQPDQESTIRGAQGNILAVYTYDGSTLKWAEQDLYGSSRVGLWSWNSTIPSKVMLPQSETDTLSDWYLLGSRDYELTNHLGNVLSVITDKKVGVSSNNSTVDYYPAEVLSQADYYPFGMEEPGRSMSAIPYPYAFNGKRMENVELYTSNQYDYGMRFYDARVGRFYSVDPLAGKYPELSPYQFASNSPISGIDLDGLEKILYIINFDNKDISETKIQLQKAGPLGNGVAIRTNKDNLTTYFYGNEISPETGQEFTEKYEGVKKYVYYDSKHNLTGGIGHKLTQTELKTYKYLDPLSDKTINNWWSSDYTSFESEAMSTITNMKPTESQKAALTDFAYNIKNSKQRLSYFNNDVSQGGNFF